MSAKITYSFDFSVGIDPYRRDTGGLTVPRMFILPRENDILVCIHQDNPGETGIWVDDLLNVDVSLPEDMPDEESLGEYLSSDEAQDLIERITAGYDTCWSGRQPGDGNLESDLDSDAQEALENLEGAIADLPASSIVTWTCDGWFSQTDISLDSDLDEIRDLIANPTGDDPGIRLADDAEEYILDELKSSAAHLRFDNLSEHHVLSRKGALAEIEVNGFVISVRLDNDEIADIESVTVPTTSM